MAINSVEKFTSTGTAGEPDYHRSYGRAYQTLTNIVTLPEDLIYQYRQLTEGAKEHGRRRWVLRARCTPNVVEAIKSEGLPLEAQIPLSYIDEDSPDSIVIMADAIHSQSIPELDEVNSYWRNPNYKNGRTPKDRLMEAVVNGYKVIDSPDQRDVSDLQKIWWPFGWKKEQVIQFIESFNGKRVENLWFSGIRDGESGRLISACMAEALSFAGIQYVESTEYGTLPSYQGQGLCTAAVVALNSQILDYYYRCGLSTKELLVNAEFNMTTRSDVVGRHAGLIVPAIENTTENTSLQVLRRNVAVLDGYDRNDVRWYNLDGQKALYAGAYSNPHCFWRNFIVGILPQSAIQQFYNPDATQQMVAVINK